LERDVDNAVESATADLCDGNSPAPLNFLQKQAERTPEGRSVKVQSGNPAGRPVGSRNKATLIAETLLDGGVETLTRTIMDHALDGNATAMRLCFERIIAPRRARPVQFNLPPITETADADPAAAMAAVTTAMTQVGRHPRRGGRVAKVVDTYVRALEVSDFDRRLKALEAVYAADA
jgi:hypothetical protein